MSHTTVRRQVYVALPTPRGSTRIHRIEMTDAVTGRDLRIDVAKLGGTGGRESSLGRAVRWLRHLASQRSE
ncbi:MAG: hypothetical protein HYR48_04640 [Gemmatimonadetes bacterium]|nr:hypothetical protein [Gemmatimonadota bacterium]